LFSPRKRFVEIAESDEQGAKIVYSSRCKLVSKYINYLGEISEEKESISSTINSFYWYKDYFLDIEERSKTSRRGDLYIHKVKNDYPQLGH